MTLDQEAYNAGFTSTKSYQRHLNAIGKKADIESNRAGTPDFEPRRSDRFMGAGEAGVPISKNRLAESIRAEQEEKLRTTYAEFVAFGKFETVAGRDAAARLTCLMGYTTVASVPKGFGQYLLSDEVRQRFMQK
jgi:hypothetical protein